MIKIYIGIMKTFEKNLKPKPYFLSWMISHLISISVKFISCIKNIEWLTI